MKYALLIAMFFTLSYGNCAEETRLEACEKVYVQPDQISITGDGIFVYVGNVWLAAKALHADAAGVFARGPDVDWTWTCPCGEENSVFRASCKKCGRRHGYK